MQPDYLLASFLHYFIKLDFELYYYRLLIIEYINLGIMEKKIMKFGANSTA